MFFLTLPASGDLVPFPTGFLLFPAIWDLVVVLLALPLVFIFLGISFHEPFTTLFIDIHCSSSPIPPCPPPSDNFTCMHRSIHKNSSTPTPTARRAVMPS
ncbi:hypothetical protein PTI98_010913 [Pleurotus ostreatus]|nr:hypothetical protein PTI98_010913 [Pleurotus ostreatus]